MGMSWLTIGLASAATAALLAAGAAAGRTYKRARELRKALRARALSQGWEWTQSFTGAQSLRGSHRGIALHATAVRAKYESRRLVVNWAAALDAPKFQIELAGGAYVYSGPQQAATTQRMAERLMAHPGWKALVGPYLPPAQSFRLQRQAWPPMAPVCAGAGPAGVWLQFKHHDLTTLDWDVVVGLLDCVLEVVAAKTESE